jgi:hypothetical protein
MIIKFRHTNQLRQLIRRNPSVPTIETIAALILAGKMDEAATVIVAAMYNLNGSKHPDSYKPPKPHRSDTCENCGHGWRQCGCQSMKKMADLPDDISDETASEVLGYETNPVYRVPSIGEYILSQLNQEPAPDPAPPPTEAEKARGLAWALGGQQGKNAKGTIPAAWL